MGKAIIDVQHDAGRPVDRHVDPAARRAVCNGDRTVTTATGEGGYRTITYRELGEQAARLANALRRIGITGDERVATFMWNNAEHLAAYLAAPAMGAVLHTLNIRLSPEQIAYIANEAEDRVIVADCRWPTSLRRCCPCSRPCTP